jgi:DinB superfamily
MATRDDYLKQPLERRLARLARTPDDLETTIREHDDAMLARRPEPNAWSAKEVVCHLRDIEELCMLRYHAMLAMDEPRMFVVGVAAKDPVAFGIIGDAPYPLDAERWAEERQYLRNDTAAALAAFRRRRGEALGLLRALTSEQWRRGGLVPTGARVSFDELVAVSAAHDDTHLDQLVRALAGRP